MCDCVCGWADGFQNSKNLANIRLKYNKGSENSSNEGLRGSEGEGFVVRLAWVHPGSVIYLFSGPENIVFLISETETPTSALQHCCED